jgi:phosphonate transport system permease protein
MALTESASSQLIADFEARRRLVLLKQRGIQFITLVGVSALLGVSFHVSGFFTSNRGSDPFGRIGDLLGKMLPDLNAANLLANGQTTGSLASWFYDLPVWGGLLWETVQIALVATIFGAVAGFFVSLFASSNLCPIPWVRWSVRRTLEVIRTLPDLIVALILVAAFGVGPLPGVIAIAFGTTASLGKLFSEVNETIDWRPVEAIKAAGGGWWAQIRYGVVPQVLPTHASYALMRLEVNVGAAAALGVVGAGGIGIELSRAITYTEFDTYLALLILIVGLIFLVDIGSELVRHNLIGLEASR